MHNTTSQRFEIKYIISEAMSHQILQYMEPYVTADEHTRWGEAYPVNSLYLDSDSLRLYWSSRTGEKNRMKLRIRSYTDQPEDPVSFEIKRRVDQVILKQRAFLEREAVEMLFRGEDIPSSAFIGSNDEDCHNFFQFRDYMEGLSAKPQCMVRYEREAYMSDLEEPVRITFDRELAGLRMESYDPSVWSYGSHWTSVDTGGVILEIKFTDTFPYWVRNIIQRFQLPRDSYAKYVAVMDAMKREGRLINTVAQANEDPMWSVPV
ncbi:MAG: polyphosphate polymerase domain-containing protein [Candidatus Sumerlaeota bacterium]|nr:polyphosphate polymerase domain-containing protein [Candidatus Sumerlaeota bacterium]